MSQSVNARLQRDSELLWHPYSSLTEPSPVRLVRGASGVRLQLDDGRTLTPELLESLFAQELEGLGPDFAHAGALFRDVATRSPLADFLTLPAYRQLA